MHEILLLFTALIAGILGSLLGLGGGIIIVPALTLLFHVNIRYAVAASLISVVATSSGSAATYLKGRFTNVRIASFLEVGTVTGAITGFFIAKYIQASALYTLFGIILLVSAGLSLRTREEQLATADHPWSAGLKLASTFQSDAGSPQPYRVAAVPLALVTMFAAGILSALLGIGSGILKVLAMDSAMKLPIKVSSATSNLMIGVTAAASASAYLMTGDVRPEVAIPVSIGTLAGSWIGAHLMLRLPGSLIRKIFVLVLSVVAVQMIRKGLS